VVNLAPSLEAVRWAISTPTDPMTVSARLHQLFAKFVLNAADPLPYALLLEGMDPVVGTVGETTVVNTWAAIATSPVAVVIVQDGMLIHQNVITGQPLAQVAVPDGKHLQHALRQIMQHPQHPIGAVPHGLPFTPPVGPGAWAGLMGYPLVPYMDSALTDMPTATAQTPSDWSALLWCQFATWAWVHRPTGQLIVLTTDPKASPNVWCQAWEDSGNTPLSKPTTVSKLTTPASPLQHAQSQLDALRDQGWMPSLAEDTFATAAIEMKAAITRGESYQGNVSVQWANPQLHLNAWQTYTQLVTQNPSPFSGWFHTPQGVIISNSPERLIQVDAPDPNGHQRLNTRPIAGTRGRGTSPEEEAAIADALLSSPKECAEHAMLVDLARNDLGRVSKPGSVVVRELMTVERYSQVTHLVSQVESVLRPELDWWAVLASVFPCGTITGCPKIRTIQLLDALEPESRGPYTGALGYIDPLTGVMDWNILIRSLYLQPVTNSPKASTAWDLLQDYRAKFNVGAGIVADSNPTYEYAECARKAQALVRVLGI